MVLDQSIAWGGALMALRSEAGLTKQRSPVSKFYDCATLRKREASREGIESTSSNAFIRLGQFGGADLRGQRFRKFIESRVEANCRRSGSGITCFNFLFADKPQAASRERDGPASTSNVLVLSMIHAYADLPN
jgi:hypothetical protein